MLHELVKRPFFTPPCPRRRCSRRCSLSLQEFIVLSAQRRFAAAITPRMGDTKVPISLLEKGAYINYQRIQDNLAIVRERHADPLQYSVPWRPFLVQIAPPFDVIGEDCLRPLG